jgi:CelD/BcsL family acetyltransferase involved in cellulose biosynthesis
VIDDLGRIAEIEDVWRRLAIQRGNAFLTPEWFRVWLNGDAEQSALIVVGRRNGDVVGVMPLVDDRSARPAAVRFAGSRYGDRFGIAAAEEDEEELAATAMPALEAVAGSTMVVLGRVDAESDWPAAMAAAAPRRRVLIEQRRADSPHVTVAGLDWDGYLAQRSKKFRQRIGRGLERALDQQGVAHSVRETGDPAALDSDMATLFQLHDARHEAHDDSSISDPEVRTGLAEFARAALEQGWLRLRILELDGQPAAAYLGWRLGPCYAVYQSGFDPAYAEQGAGMLLLNDTVRSAIGERADDIDLLLGQEPFKWRFAPERRTVRTVTLVRPMQPARILVSAEAGARRYGRRLGRLRGVQRPAKALARLLPGGR